MQNLCLYVVYFATIIVTVSSAFLSDTVKLVHFYRAHDGSDTYDFEYETDNGAIYRGKTATLLNNERDLHIHLLFVADNIIYWVEFTNDEFDNKKMLSKMVRLVQRGEDNITMKDDFVEYSLTISQAFMFASPYQTRWDLDNICFTKNHDNERKTFNYTISATNNSRKYNGTTYLDADDPMVQCIHLKDGSQREDVYQVIFTSNELNQNTTFCRAITKIISQTGVLAARPYSNIDPNAIKSLVG